MQVRSNASSPPFALTFDVAPDASSLTVADSDSSTTRIFVLAGVLTAGLAVWFWSVAPMSARPIGIGTGALAVGLLGYGVLRSRVRLVLHIDYPNDAVTLTRRSAFRTMVTTGRCSDLSLRVSSAHFVGRRGVFYCLSAFVGSKRMTLCAVRGKSEFAKYIESLPPRLKEKPAANEGFRVGWV